MKHMNMTYIANVLRGIIIVLLLVVIGILVTINNHKAKEAAIVPTEPVAETPKDQLAAPVVNQAGSNEDFVHPPAEGKFISDGVQNFTSHYDKSTRIMTIEADVAKSFFFEASAAYKVYNKDGVAIIENGFQPILAPGEDYISSPKSHLHAKIIFTVPSTVHNGEIMAFRFIADNPSGLDQYAGYWGTTIKAR